MIDDLIFTVTEGYGGQRLDTFLAKNNENLSRSFLKKHIDEGGVTIGGKAAKAGYKLKTGDIIAVAPCHETLPDVLPENIPLDIVYEDSHLILINKPQGMVVHPAAGHFSGTLVSALMFHCKDNLSTINGVLRPGIVHRIDMDTSGLIIAAKNDKAHKSLSEQLQGRKIKKIYEAYVLGAVKGDVFTISKPIGRSEKDRKKMCVTDKNSKEATTNIRVIERFRGASFIEAELITGRTHQIRVHMAHIGHPLLGDKVYGPEKSKYNKLRGQALFAKVMGFTHPATDKYMEFEIKRPEYMEELLQGLRGSVI